MSDETDFNRKIESIVADMERATETLRGVRDQQAGCEREATLERIKWIIETVSASLKRLNT
jgi:hypothetical protein